MTQRPLPTLGACKVDSILTSAVWKTQSTASPSKAFLSFCHEPKGLESRVRCAFNQKLRSSRRPLRVVGPLFFPGARTAVSSAGRGTKWALRSCLVPIRWCCVEASGRR